MESKDSDTATNDVSNKGHSEAAPLATPSGDPISAPQNPENNCPRPISPQLATELAKSLHPLQVTPPVSTTTPNIAQATPIPITRSTSCSSNSLGTNSFYSLLNRHTVVDCYTSLPALKRTIYGLPSMVQRLSLESRLKEHQGCVNCINFSWAGDLLASGSDDLHVVLWNWASGKVVKKFDSGHVANVFQVS